MFFFFKKDCSKSIKEESKFQETCCTGETITKNGESKVSRGSDKVLTQWVCFAILVWDGEDSDDGVAVLPQLLVHLLTKQTLTNHCNLHLHDSLFCRGSSRLASVTGVKQFVLHNKFKF